LVTRDMRVLLRVERGVVATLLPPIRVRVDGIDAGPGGAERNSRIDVRARAEVGNLIEGTQNRTRRVAGAARDAARRST
jgi:hypothetical protein